MSNMCAAIAQPRLRYHSVARVTLSPSVTVVAKPPEREQTEQQPPLHQMISTGVYAHFSCLSVTFVDDPSLVAFSGSGETFGS